MTELSLDTVRERAREAHEEHHDPVHRVVAVLIMTVTLLAALTAYLQTQAGSREAIADRNVQETSIQTMSSVVDESRQFGIYQVTQPMYLDLDWLRFILHLKAPQDGIASAYAERLSKAYAQATVEARRSVNAVFGGNYQAKNASFDYSAFYADQEKPYLRAEELQKAYTQERSGWSAKRGRYVTVITIFAVALFLLGLTLTVPATARKPFLWMGSAVAIAATAWGIVVLVGNVAKPAGKAIEAYVQGAARVDQAQSTQQGAARAATDRQAIVYLDRAVGLRPDYQEAYLLRGSARFSLDFLDPRGPQGSQAAADDWRRAVELAPRDYVSWGDLGAAEFWLGHYTAAITANQHALALKPNEPTFTLNQALYLKLFGRAASYQAHLKTIYSLLAALPSWLRESTLLRYKSVIDLGVRYRPTISAELAGFWNDLLTIDHQITVATRLFGNPRPPRTAAKITSIAIVLDPSRRVLRVHVRYSHVGATDLILYDTYVDDARNGKYSLTAERFSKTGLPTPDGGFVLSLTDPQGWKPGTHVRYELFVQGNLIGTHNTTIQAR